MLAETRMLFEEAIQDMSPNDEGDATANLNGKNSSLKRILVTRALNGLASLLERTSPELAAKASSDSEVLLRLLEMPEFGEMLIESDPLAAARVRGLRAREQLLNANGGVLSSQEAAEILNISRQAIDKRRKKRQLIGLSMGRRGYVYPVWQFAQGGTVAGLESVLAELHDQDPWMQTAFIVNSNTRLNGESPLKLLLRGDVEAVIEAAREYGKHGAA